MRRLLLLCTICLTAFAAGKFRPDDPLEYELKPLDPGEPAQRKLSDYYDAIVHTVATPGELNRDLKAPVPSKSVNTLGEPLQGAWWVKRHYYKPMSIEELLAGPGASNPPSMSGPWRIIGAKTEGVTPGFVIRDSRNELYFMKFDPMSNPDMATAADHITMRLMYALGYHVPENYIVEFPESLLELTKDVTVSDRLGRRRRMTGRDLAELLMKVPRTRDGKYRATASRAIVGRGIGPYRYYGSRRDDPNDYVRHEHRRDLRGLAVISAWIGHDDSRAINTFDAVVEENGAKLVKHFILDLGSTLGSGTQQPNSPRSGGEYLFAWKQSAVQLFTLGLAVPYWAKADFPKLPAVGRFEHAVFDPERWVPEYPNPAFLNKLPEDEFWAAKQIMALRDEEIRAIVRSAHYSDPAAEAWVTECLIRRRDKIGKAYFQKLLPIDKFAVREGKLVFDDLWSKAGFGPAPDYSIVWMDLDNSTGAASPASGPAGPAVPVKTSGYRVARITSASRPKQSVDVTIRFDGSGATVAGIERQ